MRHPALGIVKGVYSALNGNVTLGGETIPVYSTMPQGVEGYYIYISSLRNQEDYTKQNFGGTVRFDVKVISPTLEDSGSKLGMYDIATQVMEILRPTRAGNLALDDDLKNKLFYLEDSRELEDVTPTGKNYQVVLSMLCEYEQNGIESPRAFSNGFSDGFN
jgi:hypothetical protein